MSKKFWTLRPAQFYTKQLPSGGRNQIAWAVVGCALLFWARTRSWCSNVEPGSKNEQVQKGSSWF